MPTVGLVMIVKNEEAVIERALRSAGPFVSVISIVDTGSTDQTKAIIQRVAGELNLTCHLYDKPWVNFGHNRSEALRLAGDHMDWGIMLDADDSLMGTPPGSEVWNRTDLNSCIVPIHHGSLRHHRTQVFYKPATWTYKGAVHEYPECTLPNPVQYRLPESIWIEARCEGARSQDPEKYLKDAQLLVAEMASYPGEKKDPRSLFYCAQSYRDAGKKEESIYYYRQRLTVDGWAQERYIALLNLIRLTTDDAEQIDYARKAIELDPSRLEAPYALLSKRRLAGKPFTHEVYAIGLTVSNRKVPASALFIEKDIYDWRLDDELSVTAFWSGHYAEGYAAACRALMHCPTEQRERIRNSAQFCFDKL
jgi:glycosyltransferase involved in cell wall biosynthesis